MAIDDSPVLRPRSSVLLHTTNPIDFVIVGGGIAGLACAFALARVGHRAVVLERGAGPGVRGVGGVRLPPNLTKILFHWGLKEKLKVKARPSHVIRFQKYETGEPLGEQIWDTEALKETGGRFMVLTHGDLYDILYEAAVGAGVDVRTRAEVVEVDPVDRAVRLGTGEVLTGDVIVGADGEYGLCRTTVVGQETRGTPTGVVMYDTVIPADKLPPSLASIQENNEVFVAFGDSRSIVAFPVRGSRDIAFQFYGPDDTHEGRYGDRPSLAVAEFTKTLAPQLQSIVKYARRAVRIPIRDYEDLDEWVEDDGRLVLIGQAAHPFPPGTIQATAMAIEDGAVLAKLFSHLSSDAQIESFLYAFQDLRHARATGTRASEFGAVFFMAMPAGPQSRGRDDAFRATHARGANVLDNAVESGWEEIRTVFGYDCEDEADNWWVEWGLLRERATSDAPPPQGGLFDFAAMVGSSVQVSEATTEHAYEEHAYGERFDEHDGRYEVDVY